MPGHLTLQERTQLAARYKALRSVVQVQRWWRTIKGRHAQVDAKTIKNSHAELIATGSVADIETSGHPSNSRDRPDSPQICCRQCNFSIKFNYHEMEDS